MIHRAAAGLALGLACVVPAGLGAQDPGPAEASLSRRITVRFVETDIPTALARLRTIFGLPLAYSSDLLPAGHRVTLAADGQTVGMVLDRLLAGSGLTIVPTAGGTIVVTPERSLGSGPTSVPGELATGIQQLDQIVVMGTPVAGAPEREQPNAVSVARGDELSAFRHSRTADLVRMTLPGLILWDRGPSGPPAEIAAVRGASSFTNRGIKTYIDGVELASPTLFTLVAPRSIERIEVIRGPQGAALYGADAINGIVHIVTRKGRIGDSRLEASASASAGPFDREALPATMVRQSHAATVGMGGAWSSFHLDGHLDRVGSGQSVPNTRGWGLHGGGQLVLGSLLLRGTARATSFDFLEEAIAPGSLPSATGDEAATVDAATVGLTAVHQTTDRWVQTLVVGYDRARGALGSSRSPIATLRQPLAATHERATRQSVRFHSSLGFNVGRSASATATAGLEHSRLERARGHWETAAVRRYVTLYGDDVLNTGTFLQGKVRFGPLVLSGGARTEWNSSFGPDVGAALSSNLGASWTEPIGEGAIRVRTGWGRGIRPPEPGMSRGMASAYLRQEPNLALAPEVQAGFELGVDLFAAGGSFLRATVFDQRASDLIQSVIFPTVTGGQQRYQYQNVGAIRNRGVELEAGLRRGPFAADLQLHFTSSTVERLGRSYSGYLQVGDDLPETPASAGAARVAWAGRTVQVALGATLLGPWTGYDWTSLARVVAAQDAPRPSIQDYLIRYPEVIKPYLMVSFDVARQFGAFLTVDNLTNTARFERHNGNPPAGRSALVGLEIRP